MAKIDVILIWDKTTGSVKLEEHVTELETCDKYVFKVRTAAGDVTTEPFLLDFGTRSPFSDKKIANTHPMPQPVVNPGKGYTVTCKKPGSGSAKLPDPGGRD